MQSRKACRIAERQGRRGGPQTLFYALLPQYSGMTKRRRQARTYRVSVIGAATERLECPAEMLAADLP